VSPVAVKLEPMAAAMSPAATVLDSSFLFACIRSSRPMRSFLSWSSCDADPASCVPE